MNKETKEMLCPYASKWEDMSEDLREMKSDIKLLLRFKWQIMGGMSVLTVIVTSLIALFK